ncbi:MAG: HflK protein [bacterium]|nr:MAG: HflK protein [bacterium]
MAWDDKFSGKGGGGQTPPPIDFSKIKLPNLPHFGKGAIAAAAVILLALWAASGLYKVNLDERGVTMLFGKFSSITTPGLNWYFPQPIGKVVKVRVEEIKRVEIGFRSTKQRSRAPNPNAYQEESLMLTKSVNIIDVDMVVQYQISDPVNFLFKVADVRRVLVDRGLIKTVKNVAEAALREVVGRTEIDGLLTTEKSRVQVEIQTLMQEILDRYESGLTVGLVQFQDVHPPQEVNAAFKDVNNAEEDKNRSIREAEGYQNSIIPRTRGKAEQIIKEAEAYREEKIKRAQGDVSRFLQQLKQYRKAKDITRKRLYLETMESVLAQSTKIIMDKKTGEKLMPIIPLAGGLPGMSALQGVGK